MFSPCWARNSLLGPAGSSPSLRPEFPAGPDSLLGPPARPRWHTACSRESGPSREFRPQQQGKNTNPPTCTVPRYSKSLSASCRGGRARRRPLLSPPGWLPHLAASLLGSRPAAATALLLVARRYTVRRQNVRHNADIGAHDDPGDAGSVCQPHRAAFARRPGR
eukprot:COSAG01_NODE_5942_length_3938_cov_6.444300_1_plen_164_part_00